VIEKEVIKLARENSLDSRWISTSTPSRPGWRDGRDSKVTMPPVGPPA